MFAEEAFCSLRKRNDEDQALGERDAGESGDGEST